MASILQIQILTCAHFRLPLDVMLSPKRSRKIARPRQLAMYLARTTGRRSYPEIGRAFGRDHTTVLSAYRRIGTLLQTDIDFASTAAMLRSQILGTGAGWRKDFAFELAAAAVVGDAVRGLIEYPVEEASAE